MYKTVQKMKKSFCFINVSVKQKLIFVFTSTFIVFSLSLFFIFRLLGDINDTHKTVANEGITVLAEAKSISNKIISNGFEMRRIIQKNLNDYNPTPKKDLKKLEAYLSNLRKNVQTIKTAHFLSNDDTMSLLILFEAIEDNFDAINKILFTYVPELKKDSDVSRQRIKQDIARIKLLMKRARIKGNATNLNYSQLMHELSLLESRTAIFHYSFSSVEIQRSRAIYTKTIEDITDELMFCAQEKICQDIASYMESLLEHTSHKEGYFYDLLEIKRFLNDATNIMIKTEGQNIKALHAHIETAVEGANIRLQQKVKDLEKSIFNGKIFVVSAIIVVLIASISILLFFIIPVITNRLKKISNQTYNIANGKLDVNITPEGSDEITKISEALEYFRLQLIKKKEVEGGR